MENQEDNTGTFDGRVFVLARTRKRFFSWRGRGTKCEQLLASKLNEPDIISSLNTTGNSAVNRPTKNRGR
uniref:Uncharacterized protein n=1 Tax=Parascaris univalens TaxID=6257 RepID=A0A915AY80_PARUN